MTTSKPIAKPIEPTEPVSEDARTLKEGAQGERVSACGGGLLKKIEGLDSNQRSSRAEKARLVLELRPSFVLPVLLQVAGLSRSTFYYQAKALEPPMSMRL
jgi:hypothetical protein